MDWTSGLEEGEGPGGERPRRREAQEGEGGRRGRDPGGGGRQEGEGPRIKPTWSHVMHYVI